jgi:hypothetical protein
MGTITCKTNAWCIEKDVFENRSTYGNKGKKEKIKKRKEKNETEYKNEEF